jgi:SAM-dependent methyltransferase
MSCPFCSRAKVKKAAYPRNNFNNKIFHYVVCLNCGLVYLNEFPSEEDYEIMYPPTYQQNKAEISLQPDPYIKIYGLRFSYGYQFDLIKQNIGPEARILDYGCGTGHFISNAVHCGFACDGVEFNRDFLRVLQDSLPGSNFFTIKEVLAEGFLQKYDVIRLSNVLEHLTTPREVIAKLKKLLVSGGILLIEGPIEDNLSVAELFRKIYFRIDKWIKPDRVVSSPPYHIFFSNARNQRWFFKDCGFEEVHFKTSEEAWPFSHSIKEAKGIKGKVTAIVAKLSKKVTKISGKNWGNIFIYCGKVKD